MMGGWGKLEAGPEGTVRCQRRDNNFLRLFSGRMQDGKKHMSHATLFFISGMDAAHGAYIKASE